MMPILCSFSGHTYCSALTSLATQSRDLHTASVGMLERLACGMDSTGLAVSSKGNCVAAAALISPGTGADGT